MSVTASRIHASATVHPDAQLAESVVVGANVVVEADVVVAENSELLTGTVLHGGARVGKNCRLGPYTVVGGTPMDANFSGEPSFAVLEDNIVLREFVTVHRATGEGAVTKVGAGTLAMTYAHISHNVQVGQSCTLTTGVQLGGHCEVGDFAVIGSMAVLHQFCRVGAYAMYGAGSAANQDILPYSLARGNPAKHYRLNRVGLQRRGISKEAYDGLEQAIRACRKRDWTRLEALAETNEHVRVMLEFKASSKRGICSFV